MLKLKKNETWKNGLFPFRVAGSTQNESHQFEIITSGQEATETKIESSTLIVGSSNTIGGFESLLPEASTNDGNCILSTLKTAIFGKPSRVFPNC